LLWKNHAQQMELRLTTIERRWCLGFKTFKHLWAIVHSRSSAIQQPNEW
jgi:hypothetical protein